MARSTSKSQSSDNHSATKKDHHGRASAGKKAGRPARSGQSKSLNEAISKAKSESKPVTQAKPPLEVEDDPYGQTLHNQDQCGNCGIGGKLICCERCPEAFHFLCCVPPLDPDNLPEDEWLCNRCRGSASQRQTKTFLKQKIDPIWQSVADRFNRTNPKSFSLPLRIHRKCEKVSQITKAKTWIQDTKCFKCHTGAKGNLIIDRLLKCTRCPLVYHIDCLPDPVAHVHAPSKWVCPNHAERAIEGVNRKRFRQTPCSTEDGSSGNESVKIIMKNFLSKIFKDREEEAEERKVRLACRQTGPVTKEEKDTFIAAISKFHHEWWNLHKLAEDYERTPNYPEVTDVMAMDLDVDSMSMDQLKATVLHFRSMLQSDDMSRDESDTEDVELIEPEFPKNPITDDVIGALRCTSTGEVFLMNRDADMMTIGMNSEYESQKPVDIDLSQLNPPESPEPLNAVIYCNRESSPPKFEMTNNGASSVWLNGVEVTKVMKESVVVTPNSVIEVCDLKFVFMAIENESE